MNNAEVAGHRPGWRMRRGPGPGRVLIIAGALGLIVYVAVVPVGYLLRGTFWNGRGLTLEFFRSAYGAIGLSTMIANSLLFAAGSTVVAISLGTTLAYLLVRTDLPAKKLVFALALVPLIIPGVLHTIAWIFLASPRIGLFNRWLDVLPGSPTFEVFSLPGMMLVEGLHLTPLVLLLMMAAFRSMDPSLEEAAAMSGASIPTIVRRITVPLVRPALLASILIMVVRALEAFEVPALLGIPSGIWVFTSRIWRVLNSFPVDYGQAGAYAMSLLAITTIGLAIYYLMVKRSKRFQTLSGRGYRPRAVPLRKWKPAAVVFVTAYIVIAAIMPLLILVYASTQPFYSVPSLDSISNATLDNYAKVVSHGPTLRALRNSLFLGVAAATTIMFVTAVAAWVITRTKIPGRWVVDQLASAPLVIPGLVVGVALLFVYLRSPLPIFGTIWILLIAYLTRYMPYGMRYSTASMYQVGSELEESALMSGASWWRTFRRVMLPLLAPGLLAGWLYIFLVSVRELSSSILLYTPGNEVLSVVILSHWESGEFSQLAALGVLLVLGMTGLVVLAQRLGSQFGVRE